MARPKNFDEEKVLEKALQLFWCKGYNATSVQDLVDHLCINRASLYDTYGDKRELFVAALKKYRTTMAAALIQTINESSSIKETLKKILDLTVDETISDKLHKGCFMVNSTVELLPHDTQILQIIADNAKDVEEAFYKAILKGQTTGEISTRHDAKALSRFFMNTVNGIRVAAKTNPSKDMLEDIVKVSLAVLE
jgi:TetR/AcrR family transcriptional repressor of nem operon